LLIDILDSISREPKQRMHGILVSMPFIAWSTLLPCGFTRPSSYWWRPHFPTPHEAFSVVRALSYRIISYRYMIM